MLTKLIFRKEIKELLLKQMLAGDISPSSRISLAKLATSLGVSVTPVREALTQLTETKIVTYIANRGFFVTELTEKEAIDIYEVISLLECDAISNIKYSKEHIAVLSMINNKFKNTQNASSRLQLDMDFHKKLTEGYTNTYALKIIEDIRVRIFIYEHEFMRSQLLDQSTALHQAIINALQKGDTSAAVKALATNWKLSINHISKQYHLNTTE